MTPLTGKLAPISGVWHIKGWKRTIVAQTIATILMQDTDGDVVQVMKTKFPNIFASFCTVHSVVRTFSNTEDSINESRSLTMQSTSVRRDFMGFTISKT